MAVRLTRWRLAFLPAATGLPDDLNIHHISIEDWDRGCAAAPRHARGAKGVIVAPTLRAPAAPPPARRITAPMNLVLVSIPSVLDPSLAPPGADVMFWRTSSAAL